ncbi:MAG: HAD-IC family P-type ATPase, partial [Chthoniobacteraceae bacterium]
MADSHPRLSATDPAVSWHELSAGDAAREVRTDLRQGLSSDEAVRRLAVHGPNRLSAKRGRSEWVRFLLQFHAPLLYILLAASAITGFLGEWVDSIVIFGVVFLNAVIGYFQEARAEKAINALARMVVTTARVWRDGRKSEVASNELVPGDIVLLESGDMVPADLRLFHVRNLQVDESALTGESLPSQKREEAVAGDTMLGDRLDLAYGGSLVTHGRAHGVVFATG